MRVTLALLAACLASVVALHKEQQRIVGGSETTIEQWPVTSSLLYSWDMTAYSQVCVGTILNTRSILTAAQCVIGDSAIRWRIRVGSTWANTGGFVHLTQQIIIHPHYNMGAPLNNDIAILHSFSTIAYNNQVRPATIAGANYHLADSQAVWAVGWGTSCFICEATEELREIQIWSVNHNTCITRYAEIHQTVTDNMLCAGLLDIIGGGDRCLGDAGGPLFHNNVVVGVSSWGNQCSSARYPGISARVSLYTAWIQSNA